MPKFRLTTDHYMHDQLLGAGTLVGDDTPYPLQDNRGRPTPPSLGMVGVDEESQRIVDEHYENVRPNPELPEGPPQQAQAPARDPTRPAPVAEGQPASPQGDALGDMSRNVPNPTLQPYRADPNTPGTRATQPTRNEVPNPIVPGARPTDNREPAAEGEAPEARAEDEGRTAQPAPESSPQIDTNRPLSGLFGADPKNKK